MLVAGANRPMSSVRRIACVLLPFAAGYYLSFLYRSINALIASDLTADLGLNAADLGLLTSMYFMVFAAVQLPCGVLIDRYGPRLVDSTLLLIAGAGSLLFALADGVFPLMLARALIGLGVAVGLMAGLKAIVLWFPPERVALANGWLVMLGALGALSATGPAEVLVQSLGWRGLFAVLAASTAAVALLILLIVPEPETKPAQAGARRPGIGFFTIYRDPRFLRIAPLAALGVGTSFSLQGLWAAPWLSDVAGLDRAQVVEHLTLMAAVLSASALLLGALAERLRRFGIQTELFLAGTLALSMAAQLVLLLGVPVSSQPLFGLIAAAGAASVLSFAVLARYFPKEVAGRANAALGVLNMGAAFGLQSLAGFIIALWPANEARYPAEAHQAALAIGLALQLAALAWFAVPRQRTVLSIERAVARMMLRMQPRPAEPSPQYAAPMIARSVDLALAQRQAIRWRRTAAASASVSAALVFLVLAREGGLRPVVDAAARSLVGPDPPLMRPALAHSPSVPTKTGLPKWRLPDESGVKP
jgi:MFS family permease